MWKIFTQKQKYARHSKWVNDIQNETMTKVMQIKANVENLDLDLNHNPKCRPFLHLPCDSSH